MLFLKKLKKLIIDIYTHDRDLFVKIKLKRIVCFNDEEKYKEISDYISAYDINVKYNFDDDDFLK